MSLLAALLKLHAALDGDQEPKPEVRQGRRFEQDGERHCTCRPACCYCRSPHDEDEA